MLTILAFTLLIWGINLAKENHLLESALNQCTVKPKVTDNDVKWLALNIYHEARGESLDGMLAVGIVTMNRVASDKYPNTVEGVVKQRSQFSWYWDGRSDNIYDQKAWEVSKDVARIVLTKDNLKIKEKIGDSLYYHANYVNPSWSRKKVKMARIDNHIFYM